MFCGSIYIRMDYKLKYLKYKKKYIDLKMKQKGGIIWNRTQGNFQNELDDTCAFCLEKIYDDNTSFSNLGTYIRFDCGHVYHYACIARWCVPKWNNNQTCSCPRCRHEQSNEVNIVEYDY
jgi:hypothetical protein